MLSFWTFFWSRFFMMQHIFMVNYSWSYTTEPENWLTNHPQSALFWVHGWTQMNTDIKPGFIREKRKEREHEKNTTNVYWSRLDLTVAVDFRITGKPAWIGGLKSCFLAEAQRTQGWRVFFSNVSIVLFVFLCGLCASARVNIYSFFHIANPGCTDKKS